MHSTRRSPDGVGADRLYRRYDTIFRDMGWNVVTLKYGTLLERVFERRGGDALRAWIDDCSNSLYSALTYQGGSVWRRHLLADLGNTSGIREILDEHDDDALQRLMTNLGGHDLETVLDALHGVTDDRPMCFIAYTIKGYGLPFAGHKDNHAGLMTVAQMEKFRAAMGVRPGHEWDKFEGLRIAADRIEAFLGHVPFAARGEPGTEAVRYEVPAELPVSIHPVMSTQAGFGAILNELGRSATPLAER